MRRFMTLVVALVAVVALAGCQGGESNTVKLGVIGPLSGQYSFYGEEVERGALMAANEINAAGGVLGKDLEIIAEDSEGDGVKGSNAYKKLRDSDKIVALIGGTFSGVTKTIKTQAVVDGMPVLSPTATAPDVTLDAPNVFRACFNDNYQGEVAATFAFDNLSLSKAAVMYDSGNAYAEGLAEAFKAAFEAKGGTVVEYLDFAGASTYDSYITTIQSSDAEMVFVPQYVAEVGPILTAAKSAGLTLPFMGGDGWDGIEAEFATEAEGMYFTNHYSKSDTDQKVVDFIAKYSAEYDGKSPSALAALAYDAVYAMAAAIEAAGSTEAADIVAALAALEYNDAVTGAIKFNEVGDPLKAVTVIQLKDGEHEVVAKLGAS